MSGIKRPGLAKDPRSESTPGYMGSGVVGRGGPAAQGGGVGKRNGIPTPWGLQGWGSVGLGPGSCREVVLPCPLLPAPTSNPCEAWEYSRKTCSPHGLAWPGARVEASQAGGRGPNPKRGSG